MGSAALGRLPAKKPRSSAVIRAASPASLSWVGRPLSPTRGPQGRKFSAIHDPPRWL